jgi:hypothetical protein
MRISPKYLLFATGSSVFSLNDSPTNSFSSLKEAREDYFNEEESKTN